MRPPLCVGVTVRRVNRLFSLAVCDIVYKVIIATNNQINRCKE